MSICVYESDIAICNNQILLICNIDNGTVDTIILPDIKCNKKLYVHNNVNMESYCTLTSIAFSNDGKYFLVCTNRKQLCLYERKTKKLISNRTLLRTASKVRFSPNNDIIVADKAGDAYLFSTTNFLENGTLILGHLSMLLDILITEDEKYILTTDRDEKIRVSMFPNSYNILLYCLGHTKFVTNISELPHEKNILVSAGGDGFLILWDYKNGKKLLFINFSDKMSEQEIDKFSQDLKNNQYDEYVKVLPVKHLKLSKLAEATSLLIITLYSSKRVLVYIIHGTLLTNFTIRYIETINIEDEPIDCFLNNNNLWILTNFEVKVYLFNDSFAPYSTLNHELKQLNNAWEALKNNFHEQNMFPTLYKRKYDNVQEYLEKKKSRLASILG